MKRVFLHIGLLTAVILAVFFPTIHGELISGDDNDLFKRLERVDSWNPGSLFFRPVSQILYYRPLTILTYHFDTLFFDMDSRWMHGVNIIFHLGSVFLVYVLSRYLLCPKKRSRSFVPFFAALIFGVHPLTTESVSWISGRTDLVAGFFVLLSASLILRYRQNYSLLSLLGAFLAFFAANFGKEVAVAFLPGALALLAARWPSPLRDPVVKKKSAVSPALIATLTVVLAFAAFFLLRFVAHGSSGQLGLTLKIIVDDIWYAAFVCLRGIGFYFKKLFVPWPLNFVILEVDPLYELLGIPVVFLVLYLMWRRSLAGAFVVAGAFLVTPSFLLMFNQIAWTPYAERYLYIPLAFLVPPTVLFVSRMFHAAPRWLGPALAFAVVCVFGATSIHRSIIWSTNLALWGDTMKKSPYSLSAKNDYGLALYNLGKVEESVPYFRAAAEAHRGVNYNPKYGVNLAIALMEMGRLDEAESSLVNVLKKKRGPYPSAEEALRQLYEIRFEKAADEASRQDLSQELEELLKSFNVQNKAKK